MTTLLQVADKSEKDLREMLDKLSPEKSAQIAARSLLVGIDLATTLQSLCSALYSVAQKTTDPQARRVILDILRDANHPLLYTRK